MNTSNLSQLAGELRTHDIACEVHGEADPAVGGTACDSRAVRAGTDFPHEIGVFLGYPLEDVIGFIRNKGQCFCCLGCWKAYSNEAQARRVFALYEKCRNVYLSCYRRGFGVARLTVAA